MITLGTASSYWIVFVSAVSASCATLLTQSILPQRTLPPLVGLTSSTTGNSQIRLVKGEYLPSTDQLRILTRIGEKISSMMNAGHTVTSKVWPDFNTDIQGRRGIFIACSHPLTPTSNEEDILRQRTWLLFAVIATVKYSETSRGAVDYIAITDPLGQSGERWYYKLEMEKAAQIHHQFVNERLSLEESCNMIVSSWHKVTSASEP